MLGAAATGMACEAMCVVSFAFLFLVLSLWSRLVVGLATKR